MSSQKKLISFLKKNSIDASFTERLKIVYRPLVCPLVKLLEYIKEDDVVADVGCGSGQFCLLVSEFSAAKEIYGIEVSERLVHNAYKLFKSRKSYRYLFEVYDGMDFPDEISKADVVFLTDVLHHIPLHKRSQFVKSLYAKMKEGARIVVKDIDGASIFVIFNKIHDLLFSHEVVHEYTFCEALDLFEKHNFQILSKSKIRMYVYPHFTIYAKK